MGLPRLLWVRSPHGCDGKVARAIADEYFEVLAVPNARAAHVSSQRSVPHVVCWDFDDAHAAELRAMRDFKMARPSTPILMLTTRHSEALAVWAFRARVWNYLVKPVSPSELRANLSILAQISTDNSGPPRLLRSVRTLLPDDIDSVDESSRGPCVHAAVMHIEKHFSEKLRQSDVAGVCGMNSCRFSRAFKAAYGITYSEYLVRFRISRACRLLQGAHTATSAGMAVGFEDPSHFARAFRKLLGMSPSEYQREKPPLRPRIDRRRRPRQVIGVRVRADKRRSTAAVATLNAGPGV